MPTRMWSEPPAEPPATGTLDGSALSAAAKSLAVAKGDCAGTTSARNSPVRRAIGVACASRIGLLLAMIAASDGREAVAGKSAALRRRSRRVNMAFPSDGSIGGTLCGALPAAYEPTKTARNRAVTAEQAYARGSQYRSKSGAAGWAL